MKSNFKKNNFQRGEMMVEVIVASSIIVVGLLGVFSLLSRSLSLNRVVSDKYIGTNLAVEGVELVKNLIDRNVMKNRPWNEGVSNGDYEMDYRSLSLDSYAGRTLGFDSFNGYYGYGVGSPTSFKRKISVQNIGGEEIRVISKVDWITRGGGDFNVILEDHFFHWR